MEVKVFKPSDIEQAREIHEKFYKDEFSFPDFYNKFIVAFNISDGDTIISCGGIRTILESVIITNKDLDPKTRREALYKMLEASSYVANRRDFTQIHAFIQDAKWERHLKRIGFKEIKGTGLVLEI